MNTKERILQESLDLFSNKGFEAVSMRDIGAAVEIRESSIYKHYAGKKAILDAIVERAMNEINQMSVELNVPDPDALPSVSRYAEMPIEKVAELCTGMMLKQRSNEFVAKFRKLLTIEQYKNKELGALYRKVFMERQLTYNEKVFEYLIAHDVLQGQSAKMMALQFFSPFFLLQYLFWEDEEGLEKALKEHAISFLREHVK